MSYAVVAGVEVASMGLVEPVYDTDEVIQIIEDRKGVYRKLIVRDGRLVGALLVGSTDAAAALVAYERSSGIFGPFGLPGVSST